VAQQSAARNVTVSGESTVRIVKTRIAAASAICLALMLSGCSGDSLVLGQLSQTAKETSSVSRSAALAIGQHEKDRITSGVLDTALQDVGQKLGTGAASLTAITAIGGIATQRDDILSTVRRAQDVLLDVQAKLSAGKGDGSALDQERRLLDEAASQLQAASKKAKG
jgi:hypothetical protein